jgi:tetratricopeptide (TPR) repeat protein
MTWQLPALLIGVCLIAFGLNTFSHQAPTDDVDGLLAKVEGLLTSGRPTDAAQILRDDVEPNLAQATPALAARFHVLMADALAIDATMRPREAAPWTDVAKHYELAAEHGSALASEQLERWAIALVELGDLDGARARLAAMKAQLLASASDDKLALRCASILRSIVTASIQQPGTSGKAAMSLLSEFRADAMLTAADEAWAAARQAELRLLDGRAQEAVDRLLVDIRRAEQRARAGEAVEFGELLLLLGRAQHQLGAHEDTRYAIELALQQLQPGHALRGEAIELLGRVALSAGELELALDHFDSVVRDYVGTPAHLPALLGRAEVRGMLGAHDQSLEDFQALRDLLASTLGKQSQGLMRDQLAVALAERHDAALATDKLDLALKYLQLSERCYPGSSAPVEIVHRMATTSRQLADDLAAPMLANEHAANTFDSTDSASEALRLYRQAAENFVKHARLVAAQAGQDGVWAESLWLAADSYERANWPELALDHFAEYLAASPRTDPRHAEAMFRMAQAHHAMSQLTNAVELYERLIRENPRSPFAAQSHVPLARCYLALDRRPEAEQQLRQVLDGHQLLTPDASGYRDAQFQLGALYAEQGEYLRSIETLDAAITANHDDPRVDEARFQLAGCYLKHALSLDDDLAAPDLGLNQRNDAHQLQREHLTLALELYGGAIKSLESRPTALDPLERDVLRSAYLARADCAFHLGRFDRAKFELAADLYDQAARRYSDQSVSLTALVQMVNCFHALEDRERASAAQLRAQARLEQLPDSAFDAPDAILDRQAWARWLRNAPPPSPDARAAAESM